jgi:hypothetical protein
MLNIFSLQNSINISFYYGDIENVGNLSFICPIPGGDKSLTNSSLKEYCEEISRLIYYRIQHQKYGVLYNKQNYFILSCQLEYKDNRNITNKIILDSLEYSTKDQFSKLFYSSILSKIIESNLHLLQIEFRTGKLFFSDYLVFDNFPFRLNILDELNKKIELFFSILNEASKINSNDLNREKVLLIYNRGLDYFSEDKGIIFRELDKIIMKIRQYVFYLNNPYSSSKEKYLESRSAKLLNENKDIHYKMMHYRNLKFQNLTDDEMEVIRDFLAIEIFKKCDDNPLEFLSEQRKKLALFFQDIYNSLLNFIEKIEC